METNRWNIHDLTQMALLVALLSASAYLAFPIPITLVTVTAQTLVLNLIALLLDRQGRPDSGGVDFAGRSGHPGLLRRPWRPE